MRPSLHTLKQVNWLNLIELYVIAFIGGWLAHLIDFPASWLTGSLVAVAAAMFAGRTLIMPDWVRDVAFVLIGVVLGTGFSPETLDAIATWPLSIAILVVNVFAMTWGAYAVLRHIGKWDHATALFASLPGALGYVMAIAEAAKADMPRVSIAQSIRLFVLLAVLPIALSPFSKGETAVGMSAATRAGAAQPDPMGLETLGLMLLAVLLLAPIVQRLKVPAGLLLAGMFTSGSLYLTGTLTKPLPDWFTIIGFISIGALIGARFGCITLRTLLDLTRISLLSLAASVLMAVSTASLCAWLLDFPFAQVFLAFSPGGFEAMVVLAFLFDMNPAYVAGHHLVRYLGLVIFAPIVTDRLTRSQRRKEHA